MNTPGDKRKTPRNWANREDLYICALKLLSPRNWPAISQAFDRRHTPTAPRNVSSRFTKTMNPATKTPRKHKNIRYRTAIERWLADGRPRPVPRLVAVALRFAKEVDVEEGVAIDQDGLDDYDVQSEFSDEEEDDGPVDGNAPAEQQDENEAMNGEDENPVAENSEGVPVSTHQLVDLDIIDPRLFAPVNLYKGDGMDGGM